MASLRKTTKKLFEGRFLLSIIILIILFFPACQPTPEQDIVVGKNDDKLREKIEQSVSDDDTVGMEIPEQWDEKIDGTFKNTSVEVSAKIIVPEKGSFPVARAVPYEITQEDANKIINALIGNAPLMKQAAGMTKDKIMQEILLIKRSIDDPNSDFNQVHEKGTPEYEELLAEKLNAIAMLEELLKTAPETSQAEEASKEFHLLQKEGLEAQMIIEGYHRFPDQSLSYLYIHKPQNSAPYAEQVVFFKNQPFTSFDINITDLNGVTISIEEAQKKAEELLENIGISDMQVSLICSAYQEALMSETILDAPQCYVFYFTREINDIPIIFQESQLDDEALSKQYAPYWPQEYIRIAVDDTGICEFYWNAPMQIESIENDKVKMLPFDEIQSIFRKSILRNAALINLDPAVKYRKIHIDEIKLGLTKITEKDSSSALLVPTWSFFGYEIDGYDGPQSGGYILDENNEYKNISIGRSFLTINALDGSIIDPKLGY